MRIAVTRTGGFAGITRRAEVETSDRVDAGRLHALARQALAADRVGAPRGAVPDGFSYEITVDGRTVHCADPALNRAQRALIEEVLGEGA
jgi:hypothetical protein